MLSDSQPVAGNIPRILISADRSSSGKTTISMGLMAALVSRGYKVQPFKVALDYIDPSYHTEITGRFCRNLDGYLMDENGILDVYTHACEAGDRADIAIIEGVRGLYEGFESLSDLGSTAQIAKILKCPVILVINARSITRSSAALVNGYKNFDPDVEIAGVILNNIGSRRHAEKAREAIEYYTGVPIIGIVPRDPSMQISMRHLGLIPAPEGRKRFGDESFGARLHGIEEIINTGIDVDRFLEIAKSAKPLKSPENSAFTPVPNSGVSRPKIGVALDEAFNFYYRDNLDLLELAGAEIVYFSPVKDTSLPEIDGLYIGGGYPELFAAELEANESMRQDIKRASAAGMPIYAECGGLMYLTEKISTGVPGEGTYHDASMPESTYSMVGALPGHTIMGQTRVVSYNIGTLSKDCILGRKGNSFKGHEFHHSEIVEIPEDAEFAITLSRGTGIKNYRDGLISGNTLGSYAHLHGVAYRDLADSLVEAARKFRESRALS
ncbi:MAG: Ni-sirohydrochlorin a,c-diamide synthase [Methanosarcina flavescens]|jgi:cobyrinic acid a,c-diamide synthase|uniref:Cobyrinate a,c-diamide synthase n=1 Tax=Methanosarcina flavescens TaxID=1715806 RepID=A0A660HPX2_9EURY|nr:Ni-sirohydrochlorin a,c-diamide synthase [Methanosarcina flavescens]AYK14320.1 Ni-sirohydrochlorin a,c-diamide synthase [Methanosarcina flavescens]NLK32312.1 Ni-sirohydrochlorin a,c-diamide synthase [Methanosarcina flavescens]